jgi:hypothetical protein
VTSLPEDQHPAPAVAALAVQVHSLSRAFESLNSKVDGLGSTQRQHTILLEGVAELRNQIDHILALVTGQDDEAPATWFWLTMSDHERDEKLAELSDWTNRCSASSTPTTPQSGSGPCWPNHPEALWELAWLYHLWTQAYLAELQAPKDAADWHDRWGPGAIRRLSAVMQSCEAGCQH